MMEHGEVQDETKRLRDHTLAHTMWASLAPHTQGLTAKKIMKQLSGEREFQIKSPEDLENFNQVLEAERGNNGQ